MNNLNYQAALKYIDLGNFDKAVEKLNAAIDEELKADNGIPAAQYRCVLGELYANIGKQDESREQFNLVLDYCNENHVLDAQRRIAKTYIDAFDGILPAVPEMEAPAEKRPGYVPLVPKPVQNKNFINKQMNKKHR
ncbi:MAG: tetratricopeptide repeat protein [Oscillospiraceae bacterium]|nr:tetratricopeptide repeat protein [Oscillospiraceae bacterium]